MIQARFRQIARLEKLATPYINRRREGKAHMLEFMREEAFAYVANLSLLILYGNPKIDEPLLNAWDRVRKSAAWQECRNNHPNFAEYGREDQGDFCEGECEDQKKDFSEYHGTKYFDRLSGMYIATPFDSLGLMYIAKYFRSYFIPDLPGADETEKLNAIFEKAPLWLLWFTHGDVYGKSLVSNCRTLQARTDSHEANGLVRCREGLLIGVHYRMVKRTNITLRRNIWISQTWATWQK